MFSSLHTSVGFAIIGAVVGEYLGSAAGLGYLIQQAGGHLRHHRRVRRHGHPRRVRAGDRLGVTLVESRLLVWRPRRRRPRVKNAIQGET
mgnify:CR=1 FL=1